jgi:hypothetical protein
MEKKHKAKGFLPWLCAFFRFNGQQRQKKRLSSYLFPLRSFALPSAMADSNPYLRTL